MPAEKLKIDDKMREAIVRKFEAWLRAQRDPDRVMFGRASSGRFFPGAGSSGSLPRTPNQIVAEIRAWTPWARDLMERWIGAVGLERFLDSKLS
jgi:hypothetical protein